MGETTNSSEDSSPKNVRLNRSSEKSCRSTTKNENRVTNGLPKTVTSSLKGRQTETMKGSPLRETVNKNDTATSEASPVIKSRYGRTHKPKIPEDFLPTDKKVAAILGHSPHKSPGKIHNSPTSSPSEVAKVTAKGRKLYDIFTRREKTSDGACGSVNSLERNSKSEAESSNHKRNDNLEKKAESVVINGTTQVKIKEEITETSVQRNESFPACDWRVGDLAWARVSGYPFWPCMIALDPEKGIFTRVICKFTIFII
jgi:PWWP domain.